MLFRHSFTLLYLKPYMKHMKTISIAGCGWLGAPLARNLLAEGYTVKGSTTTPQKKSVMKDVGILPYVLTLTPELSRQEPQDFFHTDLLIINIPPRTRTEGQDYHPRQIAALAEQIKKNHIKYCIYISSTSVYPASGAGQEVTEEDASEPDKSRHPAIWHAEDQLRQLPGLRLSILRCGGLMGYDRIPGKYFAGKKNLTTGHIPVNYVHRDDVIKVIVEVIQKDYWNQTMNVVAPEHPGRKEVYLKNAEEFGYEKPTFTEDGKEQEEYKVVSSRKLVEEFQYDFIYPDPLQFPYRP